MKKEVRFLLFMGALSISATAQADIGVHMNLVDANGVGQEIGQIAISETPYGLVFSPVTDRSGLEPAIADAIAAPTPTMVVVRFKREDSVNGHRLCWEAAAAALKS